PHIHCTRPAQQVRPADGHIGAVATSAGHDAAVAVAHAAHSPPPCPPLPVVPPRPPAPVVPPPPPVEPASLIPLPPPQAAAASSSTETPARRARKAGRIMRSPFMSERRPLHAAGQRSRGAPPGRRAPTRKGSRIGRA